MGGIVVTRYSPTVTVDFDDSLMMAWFSRCELDADRLARLGDR